MRANVRKRLSMKVYVHAYACVLGGIRAYLLTTFRSGFDALKRPHFEEKLDVLTAEQFTAMLQEHLARTPEREEEGEHEKRPAYQTESSRAYNRTSIQTHQTPTSPNTHTHTHTYSHLYSYLHIHTYTYTHTHIHIYIYIYILRNTTPRQARSTRYLGNRRGRIHTSVVVHRLLAANLHLLAGLIKLPRESEENISSCVGNECTADKR
jgi:hypothetical protein